MKLAFLLAVAALFFSACQSTDPTLRNTMRSLNRDLDLVRSPYQYAISQDEKSLVRVLREMPAGQTAADAVLRADVERAIGRKINATPKVTEVRIFETHPDLRREIWLVEHKNQELAFDVNFRPTPRGMQLTVEGPVLIERSAARE